MIPSCRGRRVATLLLLLVPLLGTAAVAVPPRPTRFVTDGSGVLPAERAAALDAKLAAFERETTAQILVWIAPRVPPGTTPEELGAEAIRGWGVGQRGRDNGAILFVFTQDRKLRLATGYGLEGAIPDAVAKRILADVLKPRLAKGEHAAGIEAAVEAILAAVRAEPTAPAPVVAAPAAPAPQGGRGSWWDFDEFWWDAIYFTVIAVAWVAVLVLRRAWLLLIAGLVTAPLFPLLIAIVIAIGLAELYRKRRGLEPLIRGLGNGGGSSSDSGSSWTSDSSSSSASSSSSDFSGGGGDSGGGGASDSY